VILNKKVNVKEIIKSKELILFDLDGVIVDSLDNMHEAWKVTANKHGIKNDFSEYKEHIGIPFQDIMKKMGLERIGAEIEIDYKYQSAQLVDNIKWIPGAVELLTLLYKHGKKIGIVTSKDILRAGAILSRLNVEFTTVQTPLKGFRGKPNPDPIYRALIEAKTDLKQGVFIGDMESDYICALRAGIDYIHFTGGYGSLEFTPKIQIYNLDEINIYKNESNSNNTV